ncbi:MAG: lysylphosphatidylglycerol synthase transmembrane domain-containing protein [Alphaproteobacteria bacterium]
MIALKVAVTGSLLWWLAQQMDFAAVFVAVKALNPVPVGLAFLVLLSYGVVSAERWRRICRALRIGLSFPVAVRLFFISMFFNQTLSTTIGGDAARVWLLRNYGFSATVVVAGIVYERVAGFLGLGVLALAAAFGIANPVLWGAPLFAGIVAMVLIILAMAASPPAGPRWLRKVRRAARLARRIFISRNGVLLVALSVAIHGVGGLALYLVAAAMGMNVDVWVFLLATPPALMLATLPVSIGGWGVREAVLVAVLTPFGAASADAFLLSVIFGVMVMVAGLPGGLIWVLSAGSRAGSRPSGKIR